MIETAFALSLVALLVSFWSAYNSSRSANAAQKSAESSGVSAMEAKRTNDQAEKFRQEDEEKLVFATTNKLHTIRDYIRLSKVWKSDPHRRTFKIDGAKAIEIEEEVKLLAKNYLKAPLDDGDFGNIRKSSPDFEYLLLKNRFERIVEILSEGGAMSMQSMLLEEDFEEIETLIKNTKMI